MRKRRIISFFFHFLFYFERTVERKLHVFFWFSCLVFFVFCFVFAAAVTDAAFACACVRVGVCVTLLSSRAACERHHSSSSLSPLRTSFQRRGGGGSRDEGVEKSPDGSAQRRPAGHVHPAAAEVHRLGALHHESGERPADDTKSENERWQAGR